MLTKQNMQVVRVDLKKRISSWMIKNPRLILQIAWLMAYLKYQYDLLLV